MSELVQHDIPSVAGILCACEHRVPREDERAQLAARVSDSSFGTLLPYSAAHVAFFVDIVSRRINDDGNKMREVFRFSMKKQQARLRGDRYSNFIGEIESADRLEMFFVEKYLNVAEQLVLVFACEGAKDRNVSFEDLEPRMRELLRAQTRASA